MAQLSAAVPLPSTYYQQLLKTHLVLSGGFISSSLVEYLLSRSSSRSQQQKSKKMTQAIKNSYVKWGVRKREKSVEIKLFSNYDICELYTCCSFFKLSIVLNFRFYIHLIS